MGGKKWLCCGFEILHNFDFKLFFFSYGNYHNTTLFLEGNASLFFLSTHSITGTRKYNTKWQCDS